MAFAPQGGAITPQTTSVDLNSNDLTDGTTVIYDSANTEIENAIVDALTNFSDGDKFGGYPISLGSDTDADLSGTDLVDGNTTIWNQSASTLDVGTFGTKIDVDGNDIEDSGTTVWDSSAGHVPIGQTESMWDLVTSHSDSDSGGFDFDTGTITDYDMYKVIVNLQQDQGQNVILQCRINGNSSSNYSYLIVENGSSPSTTTGATEWKIAENNSNHSTFIGEFIVYGRDPTGSTTSSADPTFRGMVGTEHDRPAGVWGRHDSSGSSSTSPPIDELRIGNIGSSRTLKGAVEVWGTNLG